MHTKSNFPPRALATYDELLTLPKTSANFFMAAHSLHPPFSRFIPRQYIPITWFSGLQLHVPIYPLP